MSYFIDDSISDSKVSRSHTYDGGNAVTMGGFIVLYAMAMHPETGCKKTAKVSLT